jgi:hypothetical protein
MPKPVKSTKPVGWTITPATLGIIVACLSILGGLWKISTSIATKADIDSIKTLITPQLDKHETRIRDLELQMARYFGASQIGTKPTPSSEDDTVRTTRFVLAQYIPNQIPDTSQSATRQQPPPVPPRRVVVPLQLIKEFNLEPTRGGQVTLLGEDGRYYGLDDVLAIIIQIHLAERIPLQKAR